MKRERKKVKCSDFRCVRPCPCDRYLVIPTTSLVSVSRLSWVEILGQKERKSGWLGSLVDGEGMYTLHSLSGWPVAAPGCGSLPPAGCRRPKILYQMNAAMYIIVEILILHAKFCYYVVRRAAEASESRSLFLPGCGVVFTYGFRSGVVFT
jgi:hypothetical protein